MGFLSWLQGDLGLETRELEQITDIGLAFDRAQNEMAGLTDTSVPAVFRSRQFLADIVSSLQMEQVQGRTITDDTPTLLTEPNAELTYHEFMNQVVLDLVDDGNAYLYPLNKDNNGLPTRLHVAPTDEVTVNWRDDRQIERIYAWRNKKNLVPNRDIYHVAINRKSGELVGKGPVAAAKETLLGSAQAEEVIAKSMVEEEFGPRWVIKHPEARTKQDADRIRDKVEQERGNRRKRLLVTDDKSDIEQLPLNLHDAQWIEGRQFTVQQIGRLFGIHGYFLLVQSGDSLTYSTTESIFRQLLTSTLRPTYLERIEQVFTRMLPAGKAARFNTDEILRADITSRYQAYQIGVGGTGFLTVNEVREKEGLSPIAGGDELIAVSTQPKDMAANTPKEVVRV